MQLKQAVVMKINQFTRWVCAVQNKKLRFEMRVFFYSRMYFDARFKIKCGNETWTFSNFSWDRKLVCFGISRTSSISPFFLFAHLFHWKVSPIDPTRNLTLTFFDGIKLLIMILKTFSKDLRVFSPTTIHILYLTNGKLRSFFSTRW